MSFTPLERAIILQSEPMRFSGSALPLHAKLAIFLARVCDIVLVIIDASKEIDVSFFLGQALPTDQIRNPFVVVAKKNWNFFKKTDPVEYISRFQTAKYDPIGVHPPAFHTQPFQNSKLELPIYLMMDARDVPCKRLDFTNLLRDEAQQLVRFVYKQPKYHRDMTEKQWVKSCLDS